MPKGQRIKIFLTGVKPSWPRLNSFCLIAGIKTGSKKSIWIFKKYGIIFSEKIDNDVPDYC